MTRVRGERCYRVPMRHRETMTRYFGDGLQAGRHAFVAVTKGANLSVWAPIVSAIDAAEAVAKVLELYPVAVVDAPIEICPPGTHVGATGQRRWSAMGRSRSAVA